MEQVWRGCFFLFPKLKLENVKSCKNGGKNTNFVPWNCIFPRKTGRVSSVENKIFTGSGIFGTCSVEPRKSFHGIPFTRSVPLASLFRPVLRLHGFTHTHRNTALDYVMEGNCVERYQRKMSRRSQKIKLLLVVVVWFKFN